MREFKNFLAVCLLFSMTCTHSIFGQGTIKKNQSIKSEILGTETKYSVYLPQEYAKGLDFPTLYLLHGFGGDETSWIKRTNLKLLIDSLINYKVLPKVIIVMPDAGNTYYIDDYKGEIRYEEFVIHEFIPHINKTYKTSNNKMTTAIGGISMGGFGAIILAIKHPELFGTVINLSGAVRTPEQFIALSPIKYNTNFSRIYGPSLNGENRITQHWKDNSPFYLIDSITAISLRNINWYIDCGQEDFLIEGNIVFHKLFIEKNIPHTFINLPGNHSWTYWQDSFLRSMFYMSEKF